MNITSKISVYEIVTDRIIKGLEKGIIPWRMPWGTYGFPVNHNSGRPYSGINTLLLAMAAYRIPRFLTWDGTKRAGGFIKSDECKNFQIVTYWNTFKKKVIDPVTKEESIAEIPFMKYYKVWNIEQTTLDYSEFEPDLNEFVPQKDCEEYVASYKDKPPIQHNEPRAYYSPSRDIINLPEKGLFKGPDEYYCTLFHELTHSTGSKNRLNREGVTNEVHFGSHSYSQEELVAEIGASFLCAKAGITSTEENSQAYVNSWISKLKNDSKFVIHAAAAAQRAVDYMLGQKAGEDFEG
jgi:antirestriction protein ArdC